MSITNQVLAFFAYCYRGYWLDSWVLLESCLTSVKPDLDSCGLPDIANIGKELFSWPGCCRLWVRVLFYILSDHCLFEHFTSQYSVLLVQYFCGFCCVCVCVCVLKNKVRLQLSLPLCYFAQGCSGDYWSSLSLGCTDLKSSGWFHISTLVPS